MKNFTADKIAVIGLVAALILSIVVDVFTGNDDRLSMNIASALGGYMGRGFLLDNRKDDSNARN